MLYRWFLRLYPSAFRRQFGDELEADFAALCADARQSGGGRALLACYLHAGADVFVSVPREWLRTPWLAALAAAAAIATAVFYYVVVRVYRARAFSQGVEPPQSPELILLMGAMVLVPVVAMLAITLVTRAASTCALPRRRRA